MAASISRKATCLGLLACERVNVNKCVDYLLNKKKYLDYAGALAKGWPIATGVIEPSYCDEDRKESHDTPSAGLTHLFLRELAQSIFPRR